MSGSIATAEKKWEQIDPALQEISGSTLESTKTLEPILSHPDFIAHLNAASISLKLSDLGAPTLFGCMAELARHWTPALPFKTNAQFHYLRGVGHRNILIQFEKNTQPLQKEVRRIEESLCTMTACLEKESSNKKLASLEPAIQYNIKTQLFHHYQALYCFRMAAELFWAETKISAPGFLTIDNSFEIGASLANFAYSLSLLPEAFKEPIWGEYIRSYAIETAQLASKLLEAYVHENEDSKEKNQLMKLNIALGHIVCISSLVSSKSDVEFKVHLKHFPSRNIPADYFHFRPTQMQVALELFTKSLSLDPEIKTEEIAAARPVPTDQTSEPLRTSKTTQRLLELIYDGEAVESEEETDSSSDEEKDENWGYFDCDQTTEITPFASLSLSAQSSPTAFLAQAQKTLPSRTPTTNTPTLFSASSTSLSSLTP